MKERWWFTPKPENRIKADDAWCPGNIKDYEKKIGRRSFLAAAVTSVAMASLIPSRSLFYDVQEEDYLQRLGRMNDDELRRLRAAPFSLDPSGFYKAPVGVRALHRFNPLHSKDGIAVTMHFKNWPATEPIVSAGMVLLMPDGRELCRLRWHCGSQPLLSGDTLKMSYNIQITDLPNLA